MASQARQKHLIYLVWGDFCQGGVLSIFLCLSFFVRPRRSFLRPDLRLMQPAARRSGSRMARQRHPRLVLEVLRARRHTWLGSEMTPSRGARVVVHDCSCHILVCGGYRDPDHDAVMRIGSKLRGGGPILTYGMQAMVSAGTPPTSNCHRRPVANCADRQRNLQAFLSDLPFSVRDGGRRHRGRRHLARAATRR
jgi:hypothetical protein